MVSNEKYAFGLEACTFIARLKTCEANLATHICLYLYRESLSNVIFFWLFTACYVLGMFIFHAISHGLKIRFVARMLHWWIIYSQCQKIRDQSHGQISKSLNTDTSSLVF